MMITLPKTLSKHLHLLQIDYKLQNHECHVFEDGVPGLINALKAGMTVTDVRNIEL